MGVALEMKGTNNYYCFNIGLSDQSVAWIIQIVRLWKVQKSFNCRTEKV